MKRLSFQWALSWSVATAAIWLIGCATSADYQKPAAVAAPPAYTGATNGWKVAEPQAHLAKGKWWEIFGDTELSLLETDAASANQDLKAAVARFEQARALVDVSRAGLFPHLNASAAAVRARDSANRPINGTSANRGVNYDDFTVPLDFSYEFDFWGRVKREVESAKATSEANSADLETLKLAIQAELATDYFTLRALDAEKSLLTADVDTLGKALALTKNRRAGGIATDLDVSQAETVLKSTEAQLPGVILQRAKAEHAIAVLTGRAAPDFHLAEKLAEIQPPTVPVGIPSELLERRPDIAAAERRMAAANASVGVAKTAFYPTVKFNGITGFQSVSAGTLFNWPSRLWSVGPVLTVPIFEGGRLKANLRVKQAAYDETVANYRQSVLQAFSEVEDNLAAQQLLKTQLDAQSAALQAARRTLEIATNRYRSGLVTYLDVSTAQTTAIEREREVVRSQGQQLITSVALVKSLGGGWQNSRAEQQAKNP